MLLLKLNNLHCRGSGGAQLKEIDLEIRDGEIRSLVGPRGAGKSTLLMTLAGLGRVRRGEILFQEKSLLGLTPAGIVRAGLSLVPEGRRIFSALSVAENLAMGAWSRRDRAGIARDLEMVYDFFPVLAKLKKRAGGSLEPGEQQMLALGRALMTRPRLLLLDEPSRGLSQLAAEEIFAVIEKLAAEGVTILLAEENALAALTLADYGYVLEAGRIVFAAPAPELLRDDRVREACLRE
jgi:branched-chain amino acid transport system ATP-binding protein